MMNSLLVKAILTGVFFGIWPLVMNRSGLEGHISTFLIALTMLGFSIPLSFGGFGSIFSEHVSLHLAIIASVLGTCGVLLLNNILATATPQVVGPYLVLAFVIQIAAPSVYHSIVSGHITLTKGLGFAFSMAAVVLLNI